MGDRPKMKMDISAEGDMTPMIDMTFQLIAFFMVLINFAEDNNNQTIKLPASEIASISLGQAQRSAGIVGFLGSDLMGRFGLVSIDYNKGTLIVYKQIAS